MLPGRAAPVPPEKAAVAPAGMLLRYQVVGWDAGGTPTGLLEAEHIELVGGKHLRVFTRHCWGREGTSAATKDVVHLAPLARSHVLGIVPHLAAFCGYSTEMHPFEKKNPVSGNSLLSHESV